MNITPYMALKQTASKSFLDRRQEDSMEEKIYKIMRGAGALNIVLGVISLVVGIAAGVLLIISGGKLVSGKSRILF
mgnify:FL=1